MPKFKHPDTNTIVEVTEVFANEVLRPQNIYIEIEDAPVKVEAPIKEIKMVSKKMESKTPTAPTRKSKKKTAKKVK